MEILNELSTLLEAVTELLSCVALPHPFCTTVEAVKVVDFVSRHLQHVTRCF